MQFLKSKALSSVIYLTVGFLSTSVFAHNTLLPAEVSTLILANQQTVAPASGNLIVNEALAYKVDSPLFVAAPDIDEMLYSADVLETLTAVASNTVSNFSQTGTASWYGGRFHGRTTASGERFNMNAMTAAHRTLKLGTHLRVTNNSNGRSVVVKVNDRGPYHGNRIIDLSRAAADKIGIRSAGLGNVTIERVDAP